MRGSRHLHPPCPHESDSHRCRCLIPPNEASWVSFAERLAPPRSSHCLACGFAPLAPQVRNWLFMQLKLLLPPLVCATLAYGQSNSFPAKETFLYNIEWRLFSAGKAKVELTTAPQPRPG